MPLIPRFSIKAKDTIAMGKTSTPTGRRFGGMDSGTEQQQEVRCYPEQGSWAQSCGGTPRQQPHKLRSFPLVNPLLCGWWGIHLFCATFGYPGTVKVGLPRISTDQGK